MIDYRIFNQLSIFISQGGAMTDYDLLLHHNPREVTLLCERAMVVMEIGNLTSAAKDLMVSAEFDFPIVSCKFDCFV